MLALEPNLRSGASLFDGLRCRPLSEDLAEVFKDENIASPDPAGLTIHR
jgi:hypothetical protein